MLSFSLSIFCCILSPDLLTLSYFVTGDILLHKIIEELGWIFVGKVIVKLTLMRFDNVRLVWTCAIRERIVLSAPQSFLKVTLVLETTLFHLHQTTCW